MKQFTTAATRREGVLNAVDLEFSVNDTVLTATPPTSGQLTLFMAAQASGNAAIVAQAMLELMRALLGDDDWEWFHGQLQEGELDIETIMDIVEWLTEEWTARPTSSASESTPSRGSTGKRSTAKPRVKAKTR